MEKGKVLLSGREKQILAFFETHKDGTVDECAIASTEGKASLQNLFTSGFQRFRDLGVIQYTGETRQTSNGGFAEVHTRGRNFNNLNVLSPMMNKARIAVKKDAKEKAEAGKPRKQMAFRTAAQVKSAVIKGSLSKASLNSGIAYHRKKNPAYAEMLITARSMLK